MDQIQRPAPPYPSAVDTIDLARRVVTAIAGPAWQQGRVRVTLQAEPATAWVFCDLESLELALISLLHNAVHNTAPGGLVWVALQAGAEATWAIADPERLMQVLMNLLHNAVRHTPPGGLVLVAVESQEACVLIHVQDTGEGIHPVDLPRIWERFYRGQSQASGGAGLGLAVVKELTTAMHGSVAVESALGEGSRFTVSLPPFTPSSPPPSG